ncbi:MAG: hypothetical protein JW863_23245 [Chitinispirillaceae bacterium]|nr:hypothetical protein [Chitinispirillaceae bacterium]
MLILVIPIFSSDDLSHISSWGGRTYYLATGKRNGIPYVFSSTGTGMLSFEVSDPHNIREVGRVEIGTITGPMVASGNYCYCALFDSGMAIIDMYDPSRPVLARKVKDHGAITNITENGNIIAVAAKRSALIMKVDRPDNPVIMSTTTTSRTEIRKAIYANEWMVTISADFPEYYLEFYRAENPDLTSFELKQSVLIDGLEDVAVTFPYVYAVLGDGSIRTYQIEDDTINDGSAVSSSRFDDDNFNKYISINGDFIVCTSQQDGVEWYDREQALQPRRTGGLSVSHELFRPVFIDENCFIPAYDDGVLSFDCRLPGTFALIDSTEIPGYINQVVIDSNYVYAVSNYGKIITLDISDIRNPVAVHFLDVPKTTRDIEVAGDYLLLAQSDSLMIFNNRDKTAPQLQISYPIAPMHMLIEDNYAYITCTGNILRIYNLSDFPEMVPVEEIVIPSYPRAIELYRNVLYLLCDEDEGESVIYPISVAAPGSSLPGTACSVGYYASSIAFKDDFAFTVDRRYDFRVLSLSDPLAPENAGSWKLYDTWEIRVIDDVAFVADGKYLTLIDVGNLPAISIKERYPIAGQALDLQVRDSVVAVAGFGGGVHFLHYNREAAVKDPRPVTGRNMAGAFYGSKKSYTLNGKVIQPGETVHSIFVGTTGKKTLSLRP